MLRLMRFCIAYHSVRMRFNRKMRPGEVNLPNFKSCDGATSKEEFRELAETSGAIHAFQHFG